MISGIHLGDLATASFWLSVWSIIFIDLILSGDNAILIAMACRNLPGETRIKGIVWGTVGAVGLRLFLGSMTIYLLKIPFLHTVGALILIWIAVKLVIQEESHNEVAAPARLWQAVKTIVLADAVMSLDNVLAVAGLAGGKPALLWFGLVVSIPLVVYGSRFLLVLMDRFPWITYLGSGILGWTAGEMLRKDPLLSTLTGSFLTADFLDGKILSLLFAGLVLWIGWGINQHRARLR